MSGRVVVVWLSRKSLWVDSKGAGNEGCDAARLTQPLSTALNDHQKEYEEWVKANGKPAPRFNYQQCGKSYDKKRRITIAHQGPACSDRGVVSVYPYGVPSIF